MTANKSILVAGIGNIFHGDDAFGVVVAQELARREQAADVVVADFGIRSYDLAFAILDGYDCVILVDLVSRGGHPGTVYLLDPVVDAVEAGRTLAGGHSMTPQTVLSMLEAFGGFGGSIYVVGCEPATLESEDGGLGLSPPVEAAVDVAISMIEDLFQRLRLERELQQKRSLALVSTEIMYP